MSQSLKVQGPKPSDVKNPVAAAPSGGTSVKPHVVYLVRREGLSAVFASQVASKMAAVAEAGFDVNIGVFTPMGQWTRSHLRRQWRDIIASVPDSLQGQVTRLPSFPSRYDWPMAEAKFLKLWLKAKFLRSKAPVVLQCRGATVTRMALAAKSVLPSARVIFDCRGLADHEFLYVRGTDFESAPPDLKSHALMLQEEQRIAARQSDGILCVSHAMVAYLGREYDVPADKCVVVPCCVDARKWEAAAQHRDEMRRRLGLEDKLVIAYCGSLGKWQSPRESLALFQQIQQHDARAHFFGVTTQPDAMRRAAVEVGVPNDCMTIVSVPHAEVAVHLAAADIGLLLRERSPVNEVASPVKFAEYLASGTPVILSEGIGDYSDLVQQHQLGIVVRPDLVSVQATSTLTTFLNDYRFTSEDWQRRIREFTVSNLSIDQSRLHLWELYRQVFSSERPSCAAESFAGKG